MFRNNFLAFLLYFAMATILTWWFVILCPLYISTNQMLLSTSIAGAKWLIQILAALVFLKEKSFLFLKKIGFVCFIGSCLLIPYIVFATEGISNAPEFFFGSLIVSILVMIVYYYRVVKQINLSLKWWLGWLLCLAIAISLQLTVVFHYIRF